MTASLRADGHEPTDRATEHEPCLHHREGLCHRRVVNRFAVVLIGNASQSGVQFRLLMLQPKQFVRDILDRGFDARQVLIRRHAATPKDVTECMFVDAFELVCGHHRARAFLHAVACGYFTLASVA
jgi:hypothetical protein